MTTARTIAQGLTSAAFFAAGGMKLADGMADEFERFGYPQWFRMAVASGEVAAATGLAAGLLGERRFERPAGALLAATMAGAAYTHLVRTDDGLAQAAAPLTLGSLSAWIAAGE
jgi:hypothetical protein